MERDTKQGTDKTPIYPLGDTDIAAGKVSRILKNGGIAILPFDTVYGFAADATNDEAVKKIFKLKNRSFSKPLGVAVAGLQEITRIAEPKHDEFIIERIPGPYTFILTAKNGDVSALCKKGTSIGVRVPDSRLILKTAGLLGGPIAQTSANAAGLPECYNIDDLQKQFNPDELMQVDIIVDGGNLPATGPSQIFDLTGERLQLIERK